MAEDSIDDIVNVPYSDVLEQCKTGYWRKVINQFESGKWEVEVNFVEYQCRDFRNDAWFGKCTTEEGAKALYDKVTSLKKAKALLVAGKFDGT